MKQILLVLLTCLTFSLTSFSQPLMGIISSSQNNVVASVAAQNLFKYSEVLDNVWWTKASLTTLADQAVDLEGNTTLEKFTSTGTSTQLRYVNNPSTYLGVTEGVTYYISFDCKRGTMTDMKYQVFDVTHSAVVIAATSYYAQTSSTVQRVSFSFTTPVGCTQMSVYLLKDNTSGQDVYIGRVQASTNPLAPYVETLTIPVL